MRENLPVHRQGRVADGQRFLPIDNAGDSPTASINVVLNRTAEMARE